MYTMKSSLLPSDCSHCDDSGFDHAEENFCECAEGNKLMSNEMATAEKFEFELEDPYWD